MSNDYINEHAHRSIQHEGETYINQSDAKITFAIYRTHINHQAAEITRLRAEIATARNDVMEQLERYFRDAADGTPLGYEDHQRGASVYNWLMYCATTIAAIHSDRRLERVDLGASQSAADLVTTARRDGMEQAAKWHEAKALEASSKAASARNFQQLLRQSDFHMESAAAIRAAAKEGKRDE